MSRILKSSIVRVSRWAAEKRASATGAAEEEKLSLERQRGFEQGYQEGYREGFEAGHAEGFEKGYLEGKSRAEKEIAQKKALLEAELSERIKAVDQFMASLRESASRAVLSLDREILGLLKLLAQKLLFKETLRDETIILRVIREALKEVAEGARVVIKVHPQEAEFLKALNLQSLSSRSFAEIRLEEDPSVTPGGCILETDFGTVDATLENRWAEILKALEEAAGHEG
ncbi:FliH/SctL family protein [Thermosulfurimonas sp.]|uniref:FliH/SctL family protein n=1 Tax=Thermosulfurimonas sp. TaxID=2080236 RepID=UPI0025D6612E|nr:FliH/SctL family protein [Thermosulfurimonas sp.]